jgi:hypothetical protein
MCQNGVAEWCPVDGRLNWSDVLEVVEWFPIDERLDWSDVSRVVEWCPIDERLDWSDVSGLESGWQYLKHWRILPDPVKARDYG